ncbi:MAG: NADH-quinone oxidoreductase subunit NuoH [Candidatus Krumholzibacteria bacterium]|nr:NADH-quinone oxidoreductase subunit NuoH [Candidatus Krumholzibacteria bacterium]MDP6796342.1 NADH-quinone oxidoreductase subunit NuoH [Candidatus Krumholzibacteria bacterium]MDP7021028.1 NADH-quinone oxidoreductase subunit NuoH [Candidatus Krumholzibacteria bacterium]
MTAALLITLGKILFVFLVTLTTVAYLTLAERKVSAWIQWRKGPNRVGPWGLLQPIADGLKFVLKEDFVPRGANQALHALAPVLSMAPALITFSVIPFGSTLPLFGTEVRMIVADLSIGILFVYAIASLGVYGLAIGGWASNNKYALLGGLRASAQMISYEISMALAVIPIIMMSGTVMLSGIVEYQANHFWFALSQPLGFLLFLVAVFAETNRLPFDLPEAEPELVAGYHTEYSSMKFAMFFLAEYANMITASALIVTLYFGGYHCPILEDLAFFQSHPLLLGLLHIFSFLGKMALWLFIFIWVRWSLPRFRYDQLMGLGWKVLLPLSLLNLFIYGVLALARMG